ncbi:AAA domain-containing protein [Podospora didyma]|uniref:AAA domain-containing protein n=1 Tax=Podospora didyma TaxID=330526 RepID=A0AAE0NSV1_9PEZI|nr:AAA domain-containing protein [Podospora didyma]
MLDTQYRMHRDICSFSSGEFYGGKLKTGVLDAARPMFSSQFPWPPKSRMVFVECGEREEMWQKSKFNKGQAKLCAEICELLSSAEPPLKAQEEATAPKPFSEANKLAAAKGALLAPIPRELEKKPAQPSAQTTTTNTFSIAVLTPYTKQVELLKQTLSKFSQVEVCSIDGFQGREADIVVFVTVRCNEHHDIGFLKDMRRLNVALTRAKTGVIVIGNKATLTLGTADPESAAVWKRLLECLEEVRLEEQPRIAKNSRKE